MAVAVTHGCQCPAPSGWRPSLGSTQPPLPLLPDIEFLGSKEEVVPLLISKCDPLPVHPVESDLGVLDVTEVSVSVRKSK